MKKNIITIITAFSSLYFLVAQNNVVVTDKEIILNTATDHFHGIEYYGTSTYNPYENDNTINSSLNNIGTKIVQVKVHLKDIAPIDPCTNILEYDFTLLTHDIDLLISKGYTPAIQIMPDRAWFPDQQHYIARDEDNPRPPELYENGAFSLGWWNHTYMNGYNTMNTWRKVIYNVASKYKDKNIRLVIFDEPAVYEEGDDITNVTVGENEFAFTYDKAAEVYINAAEVIKGYESLNHIKIGGFAGHKIQASRIAKAIFNKDGNYDNLDFLAMNIFLGKSNDYNISGDYGYVEEDRRFQLLNRTIQFEELANVTLAHNFGFENELMIDSYNVFGAFGLKFPSNTDHFGAIFQTLAQFHAFKGGVDTMLKWNIIGSSGVFSGGFGTNTFSKNPTYYAWDFVHNIVELSEGNSIIHCRTQEGALNNNLVEHVPSYSFLTAEGLDVSDYHTDAFSIQPFAILTQDGGINVVLINKTEEGISRFVKTPSNMSHYEVYNFREAVGEDYQNMIDNPHTNSTVINGEYAVNIYCNPESISVVKFYPNSLRMVKNQNTLNDIKLDVVNSTLNIKSNNSSNYSIDFYDIKGIYIRTEKFKTEFSEIDLSFLDLGIYILKIKNDKNEIITKKIAISK